MRPGETQDVAVMRPEAPAPRRDSTQVLWVVALVLSPLALVLALLTALSDDPWNGLWLGIGTAAILVGLVALLGVLRWRHGDTEQRLVTAAGRGAAAEQTATESRRRVAAAEQHAAEIQAAAAERERQLLGVLRDRIAYLVKTEIPAAAAGEKPDEPAPDDSRLGTDVAALLSSVPGEVAAAAARARDEAEEQYSEIAESARLAAVALAQNVQNSAHRVQQTATELGEEYTGTHPDVVEATMGIDHAAAQLARNAQSIAVLCGHWPGQLWQEPIALVDVVQSARGRIAAYQRVQVTGDQEIAVVAEAAEPLIHAVAELLANATQSSPPTTPVPVSVRLVQRGAVVEIDDGGVGMDEHRLEEARAIVSGRREMGLADVGEVPQTGLAVVGTYARQYGLRADLSDSPYGGIRAVILVPMNLVTSLEPVLPDDGPDMMAAPAPVAPPAPPAQASPPAYRSTEPQETPDRPRETTSAGLPRRTALRPGDTADEPPNPPPAAAPPDESPQEAGQFLAGILGQSTSGEWPAASGEWPGENVRDDDTPENEHNEGWA